MDCKELSLFLVAQFNILIQILPLPRRSVHVVRLTGYSNADDQMVKVSFVFAFTVMVYPCTD